jgi:uncharacterized membrane protein YeaQ/YmgE (transglycosylase-associated protein family)
MEQLLISLVSGAVGGNVAGGLLKNYNLGTIWNSVVGILGGGLGGQILSVLNLGGQAAPTLDLSNILSNVGSAGVGGAVLMIVVGLIKKMMAK